MRRLAFATLLGLAVATSARAVTVYVANNGVDGPSCGLKDSPCRSIGQAANFIAAPGDTVVVGPGSTEISMAIRSSVTRRARRRAASGA
jgi:hypothetical protein